MWVVTHNNKVPPLLKLLPFLKLLRSRCDTSTDLQSTIDMKKIFAQTSTKNQHTSSQSRPVCPVILMSGLCPDPHFFSCHLTPRKTRTKNSKEISSLRRVIRIPAAVKAPRYRNMEDDDVTSDGVSVSELIFNDVPTDTQNHSNYSQATSIPCGHQNHPYQTTSGDRSVKPYMSQPMFGVGLEFDHGQDEVKEGRRSLDDIGAGHENSSDLATARDHVVPERSQPRLASSRPLARSHGFKAFSRRNSRTTSSSNSISSAILNGTQAGFAIIGFGIGKGMWSEPNMEPGFTQPMASTDTRDTDKMSDSSVATFTFPRQHHDEEPPSSSSVMTGKSACMESTSSLDGMEVRGSGIDADVIVKSDRNPDSIIIPRPKTLVSSGEVLKSTGSASPGHWSTTPGHTASSELASSMPTCAITEGRHSAAGYVEMGGDDKVNGSVLHATRIVDKGLVADAPCAVLGVAPYVADQATRTMQHTTTTSGYSKTETSTNPAHTPMTSYPPPPRTLTTLLPSSKPPPLSLGAIDRRLSFNGLLEGSARLSPSIIMRPPPLPLLNLPVLMTPGGSRINVEEEADNKSRQSGLMGIPALPLQGSSRGTRGHEVVDDLEDGDEEDDEEVATSGGGSGIGEHAGKSRSSFSSEKSTDDEDLRDVDDGDHGIANKLSLLAPSEISRSTSRTSSYVTARAELSPTTSEACYESLASRPLDKPSPRTPQADSSGFAVDGFPLLDWNSTGMSHPIMQSPAAQRQSHGNVDMKGKSKQREEEDFDNLNEDTLPHVRDVCRVPNRQNQDGSYGRSDSSLRPPVQSRQGRTSSSTSAKSTTNTPCIGGNPTKALTSDNRNQMPSTSRSRYVPPRPPLIRLTASGGGTITQNPSMYKRASKSLIDVRSIEKKEMVEKMVRDQEEEEETRRRSRRISKMSVRVGGGGSVHEARGLSREPSGERSVRESFKTAEEMLWEDCEDKDGDLLTDNKATNTTSLAPVFEALHPLRRRRSMPTANPPPYSGLVPHISSFKFQPTIQPREDEGREKLPLYSNEIHLRAIMPRKMEFVAPGILAKDRKWRRVLCVLEGTVFKVYKCPVGVGGVSTIGEWWESKVGAGLEPSSPSVNYGNVLGGTTRSGRRIRDGEDSGDNSFDQSGEVLRRQIELARARKIGEGGETGQPVLQRSGLATSVHPPSQPVQQKALGHHSSHSLGVMPTTRSALTFAVQLLKPGTRHKRSNSDVPPRSPQRQSPRSSFNIPRSSSGRTTPTTTPPTTSTTSHRGVDTMRSHSPSTASTHLTTPGSAAVFSRLSRPSTPTPSVGSSSVHTASSSRQTAAGPHHANDATSKRKGKTRRDLLLELDENDLIRTYTMQHAESGLGKDYTKRQHVIRVRLEGEQFLLQAKDVESVIGWIEVSIPCCHYLSIFIYLKKL